MTQKSVAKARDTVLSGQLLDLVASGLNVASAARQLQIHPRTAQRLYHSELRKYYEEHAAQREELVGRELRTLDLLQRKAMQQALGGELRAMDRVLSIMKLRADMLGLNAAAKISVEVSRVDDALNEIVQIIDGNVQAAAALQRVLPEAV